MSATICSCGDPTFGNLGRPNCVIEMKAIAFPIIIPRYKADGVTRNTINVLSPTLGADIQALVSASTPSTERIYPFPRCENVTTSRTETVFETAASTRKYKIQGVGGVRSFLFELWGKEAANQILRELKKYGCTEVDFFLVDVAGSIWGIKDDVTDTILRGYEMSTETFDAFKEYATDTTVAKSMISWDLDNQECEENSYAITAGELGYNATSLRGLVSAFQALTPISNTTASDVVFTGFGSAGDRDDVVGLLIGNFTVENLDVPAGNIALSVLEGPDGTYLITTSAQTAGENHRVTVLATGYDVATQDFVAIP